MEPNGNTACLSQSFPKTTITSPVSRWHHVKLYMDGSVGPLSTGQSPKRAPFLGLALSRRTSAADSGTSDDRPIKTEDLHRFSSSPRNLPDRRSRLPKGHSAQGKSTLPCQMKASPKIYRPLKDHRKAGRSCLPT